MNRATVIIPVYNAGHYLQAAVESAVAQTYQNLEILIVDDGSTDGAVQKLPPAIASACRILRQANAGKSVAMNRAIREATGEFYCILDADDEMHSDRVAKQVAVLESNQDLAAVFCGHQLKVGARRIAPRRRAKDRPQCANDIAGFRMPAHDPTGMYRMAIVRGIEYDAGLRIAQGYDYILRIGERFPMMVLGETLYTYRVHRESVTRSDQTQRRRAANEVRRRACERRGIPFGVAFPTDPRGLEGPDLRVSCDCIESVVDLCSEGRRIQALRTGLACVLLSPARAHYYRALAYAVLPTTVRRRVRPAERGYRATVGRAWQETAR